MPLVPRQQAGISQALSGLQSLSFYGYPQASVAGLQQLKDAAMAAVMLLAQALQEAQQVSRFTPASRRAATNRRNLAILGDFVGEMILSDEDEL